MMNVATIWSLNIAYLILRIIAWKIIIIRILFCSNNRMFKPSIMAIRNPSLTSVGRVHRPWICVIFRNIFFAITFTTLSSIEFTLSSAAISLEWTTAALLRVHRDVPINYCRSNMGQANGPYSAYSFFSKSGRINLNRFHHFFWNVICFLLLGVQICFTAILTFSISSALKSHRPVGLLFQSCKPPELCQLNKL
jgi:hypothetical protein